MSRAPLRYHQPLTMATRLVLGVGAMIPLYGAYEMLFAHGMSWLQWGMAPFLAMGFIALGFGSVFMGVAIFGGSRTVTIDRARRACIVEFEGSFGRRYAFTHPFSQLGELHAAELPTSDGPGHWAVQFARAGKKAIIVESYPEEARAKAEANAIVAYMAGR